MNIDKKEIFENRLIEFEQKENHLIKKYKLFSTARTIAFLAAFGGFIVFANFNLYPEGLIYFGFTIFIFLILLVKHLKVIAERDHYNNLVKINRTEINLLNNNFKALDEGSEFIETDHPYTSDLDIFGKKSLFQLLNRTNTYFGKSTLAYWLKKAANKNEITARQRAGLELSPLINWRQDFQAIGMKNNGKDKNVILLLKWVIEKSDFLAKYRLLLFLRYFLPVLSLIIIIGVVTLPDFISYKFIFLSLFLNSAYLSFFKKDIFRVRELSSISSGSLNAYKELFSHLQKEDFNHSYLKEIQKVCTNAEKSIGSLAKIVQGFNDTMNIFYAFIANLLWFSDLQNTVRFEEWKIRIKPELENWFNALAEMEALCSLSAVHYSQTDWVFPNIINDDFSLQSKELAHPLINKNKCVRNNFEMEGLGKTIIITGSNMSGKSTFQRTVGINLVLAQAGSAVCAREFEFSLTQIFTSMRTNDNLEENISSFYAELKRIKQLLDLLDNESVLETKSTIAYHNNSLSENPISKSETLPIFYLLDEILKGTNSKDRHLGAKSLILQLGKKNASGFVSTHDLVLGEIALQYPESIENYSFNSEIIDDEILFDYKIHKGVCKSFNATKLMEKMGIEII